LPGRSPTKAPTSSSPVAPGRGSSRSPTRSLLREASRSLAAELGPHGIRLVILRSAGSPDAPDIKQTFEHHARAAGISPEEFLAEASSGTLLRRLPMLSEVAEAAVVMASDRASAMTGVMANVTCGFWVDV
jgi:3-oxoacyl-[acyl-carrier protein] reductase